MIGHLYKFRVQEIPNAMEIWIPDVHVHELFHGQEEIQCSCGFKTDEIFVLASNPRHALEQINDRTSGFCATCTAHQIASDHISVIWDD